MSRSRPDRFRILVRRGGFLAMGDEPVTVALDVSDATPDELLRQAFGQLLAETGAKSVELLLSSALVDTVVMPGFEHWLSDADLRALGRARLAAFYGTDQSQRDVSVTREAYGAPGLALSAPKRLVDALRAEAAARRVAVVGIRSLAGVVIARQARKLRALQAAAVWIEEEAALWIGLRDGGRWRSARSLPASTLQHTSRSDLLQRECLAAGLAGIERVYSVAIGVAPPGDWGEMATDITQDFRDGCRPRSVAALDFGGARRHRMGYALLAAALTGLAATVYGWTDRQASHTAATETLAQRRAAASHAREQHTATAKALQVAYDRVMAAYRFQIAPWGELFTGLNESSGELIGLTEFTADALNGVLGVEGEARRFEDLQRFSDALGRHPRVSDVRITAMAPVNGASAAGVKFSLVAKWATGVRHDAGPNP